MAVLMHVQNPKRSPVCKSRGDSPNLVIKRSYDLSLSRPHPQLDLVRWALNDPAASAAGERAATMTAGAPAPPSPRALLPFITNSCCHPANRLTHSRYAKAQRERLDCAGRVGGGGGGGRGGREGSAAAQVEDVGAAARQRSARSTLGRAGRFA